MGGGTASQPRSNPDQESSLEAFRLAKSDARSEPAMAIPTAPRRRSVAELDVVVADDELLPFALTFRADVANAALGVQLQQHAGVPHRRIVERGMDLLPRLQPELGDLQRERRNAQPGGVDELDLAGCDATRLHVRSTGHRTGTAVDA